MTMIILVIITMGDGCCYWHLATSNSKPEMLLNNPPGKDNAPLERIAWLKLKFTNATLA